MPEDYNMIGTTVVAHPEPATANSSPVTDENLAADLGVTVREVHAIVAVHAAELRGWGALKPTLDRSPGTHARVPRYVFTAAQAEVIAMLANSENAAELRSQMVLDRARNGLLTYDPSEPR